MNVLPRTSPSERDRPRRFTDRFRGTRVLKSGPGGETLRGLDASDGREVVIRTMTDADPSAVDRLKRAVAGFDRLRATGLVLPLAAGRQGTVLYSVRHYVPGLTLDAHLAGRSEPLTVAEALVVGRSIPALARQAHSLKGEASTLGAGGVAALCREFESMGAPLDGRAARDLLGRVEVGMGLVRTALQAELDAARSV